MEIDLASGEGSDGMVLSFSGEESESKDEKRLDSESEDLESKAGDEDDGLMDLILGDEDEKEESSVDLGSDEDESDDKSEEPRIPKSRLDKQRKKFESQIEKLKTDHEQALAEAGKKSEFEASVMKLYGTFKDPLKAIAIDKSWMDAMESLKHDSEVAAAINKIAAKLEGKPVTTEPNRPEQNESQDKAEAKDPRVDKLVAQERGRKVSQFMKDAKIDPDGIYWASLRKEMMARTSELDIDGMDQDSLIEIARDSLKELGWTAKQVQGKERGLRKKDPPTSGRRSAAKTTAPAEEEREAKSGETQKRGTVKDWEEEGQLIIKDSFARRASP